jgi:hypothetical protein
MGTAASMLCNNFPIPIDVHIINEVFWNCMCSSDFNLIIVL